MPNTSTAGAFAEQEMLAEQMASLEAAGLIHETGDGWYALGDRRLVSPVEPLLAALPDLRRDASY